MNITFSAIEVFLFTIVSFCSAFYYRRWWLSLCEATFALFPRLL